MKTMRITFNHTPIKYNNYKVHNGMSSQSPILLNDKPSFKSTVTDIMEDIMEEKYTCIAKKYMYVKNPDALIEKELNMFESLSGGVGKVLSIIKFLREENEFKTQHLSSLEKKINVKINRTKEIEKEEKEIIDKIAKIQIVKALDRIKLAKILCQEKRKKQVFSELDNKYIALFKMENKIFPNAIMIKGVDEKEEQNAVINYLRNNNCDVYRLDFNMIPLDKVQKDILQCAKNIKENKKHSIIAIDNFDKYTIYNDENFNFINNLKRFLSSCNANYDTTILVFESNPEKLDENIIGKHRFQKEIDVRHINSANLCEFVPIYDGYTMIYDDKEDTKVDLYLGNYGYNDKVLWVDTNNSTKIQVVIKNIDKIKKINKFNNVKFIQCIKPDNLMNLNEFYETNKYTTDYQTIYEKTL